MNSNTYDATERLLRANNAQAAASAKHRMDPAGPDVIDCGTFWKVRSARNPRVSQIVRIEQGSLRCTCEHYQFRHSQPEFKPCRHMLAVRATMTVVIDPSDDPDFSFSFDVTGRGYVVDGHVVPFTLDGCACGREGCWHVAAAREIVHLSNHPSIDFLESRTDDTAGYRRAVRVHALDLKLRVRHAEHERRIEALFAGVGA